MRLICINIKASFKPTCTKLMVVAGMPWFGVPPSALYGDTDLCLTTCWSKYTTSSRSFESIVFLLTGSVTIITVICHFFKTSERWIFLTNIEHWVETRRMHYFLLRSSAYNRNCELFKIFCFSFFVFMLHFYVVT